MKENHRKHLLKDERFLSKFVRNADHECWPWLAAKSDLGYGRYWSEGKLRQAHRFSYEYFVNDIKEGHSLDHLCRNASCVNPAHLEVVTHKENCRRGNQGRYLREKTHCKRGHEFTKENTYIFYGTFRKCRECAIATTKSKHHKKPIEVFL